MIVNITIGKNALVDVFFCNEFSKSLCSTIGIPSGYKDLQDLPDSDDRLYQESGLRWKPQPCSSDRFCKRCWSCGNHDLLHDYNYSFCHLITPNQFNNVAVYNCRIIEYQIAVRQIQMLESNPANLILILLIHLIILSFSVPPSVTQ